jgi:anti-sigma factor RsiW
MNGRVFTERDVHLALDGELPEDERAAYETWLAANPDIKARAGRFADDIALMRNAVSGIVEEPVPDRLTRIVKEDGGKPLPRAAWWRYAAAAAVIFMAGGVAGYLAGTGGAPDARAEERLADSAIDAYTTYMAGQSHAVEVAGGDRAYLERWLSKRTGLKLVAPDLTQQGFELLGGRILPAERNAAALLVYKDADGDQVSIYLTADGRTEAKGIYTTREGGPVAIYWLDDGFGCAIVTALPEHRRDEVVGNAWRQIKEGLAG